MTDDVKVPPPDKPNDLGAKDLRGMGIVCLVCMRLSFNPNDIAHRYCGTCHRFHDDPVSIRQADDLLCEPGGC